MNKLKIVTVVVALLLTFVLLYTSHLQSHPESQLTSQPDISKVGYVEYVEATILVDNNPDFSLLSPWGISVYVETQNLNILFDAGPNPEALKKNAEKLGIDLSRIDLVIISHEHGDHTGGLGYIAELNRNLTVYVPKHISESCKDRIKDLGFNLVEVGNTTLISEGVAIVGELYGPPYEQALAVNVKDLGLIVFVGCSHPGVDKIVAKAKEDLDRESYAVIGGFHLSGASLERIRSIAENLVEMGLKEIYPIHCSGERFREFLKENYPDVYRDGRVGLKFVFNSDSTKG